MLIIDCYAGSVARRCALVAAAWKLPPAAMSPDHACLTLGLAMIYCVVYSYLPYRASYNFGVKMGLSRSLVVGKLALADGALEN